jgi:ribonuclease R
LQYNKSFEKQVRKEQNGAAGGGRKDRREKKSGPILLEGVFQSHVRGFGFVTVEGLDQDLYIPVGKTANAFYGDRVSVRVISGADSAFVQQVEAIEEAARTGAALPVVKTGAAGRPKDGHRTEAEVVSILSHGVTRIVGTYTKEEPNGYITPDNTHIGVDIYVRNENSQGAVTGHKVVAEITDYGSARKNPEARVTEILGHIDDPGVDILSIIRANDLPEGFPDDVRAEVENVPDSVKDRKGREDLRRVVTVTIDGEDTKDIDDAVSLVKKGKCWELGVHIADVSYYVTEGSALDKEALNRGNSIYLVDRVIPMLPHELSNGICSLNEGKDRYALSCIMTIDEKGEVIDHRITESVINSNARLTYTGVHRLLTQDDNTEAEEHLKARHVRFYKQQAARIAAMLKEMEALSLVLTKAKEKRGAIDFEFQESKIVLDEKRPSRRYPPLRAQRSDGTDREFHAGGERNGGGTLLLAGPAFCLSLTQGSGPREDPYSVFFYEEPLGRDQTGKKRHEDRAVCGCRDRQRRQAEGERRESVRRTRRCAPQADPAAAAHDQGHARRSNALAHDAAQHAAG